MKERILALGFLMTALLMTNCKNLNNSGLKDQGNIKVIDKTDSVSITTLIRELFKWHQNEANQLDFPYKTDSPTDSVYSGIDWKSFNERKKVLEKTEFFSTEFLINYQNVASRMDSAIKQSDPSLRNVEDVPSFEPEADHWCDCQDSPDTYWNILTVCDLKIDRDNVSFNWTWGDNSGFVPDKSKAMAKKENGKWKISYLQGFDIKNFGNIYKK